MTNEVNNNEKHFKVTDGETPYELWLTVDSWIVSITLCGDQINITSKEDVRKLGEKLLEVYNNEMSDFKE